MTTMTAPGFLCVARRECRWLFRDRVALILIFGVPVFAFLVLATVFSHSVIRGIGVTVVDEDRSDASRALAEYIAASPSLRIVNTSATLSDAARDLRSGTAMSAVYIPAHFERDLQAQRRPQVIAFYNQQFLTTAGIASAGLSDTLSAAAAAAAPAGHTAPSAVGIGTLATEAITLVNPQKNYAQFLLRTLLPMVLHAVIALAGGYAVGSEFRRRNAREWIACAGGNPLVALAGKLAPLVGIFAMIMFAEPLILEGVLEIPFKGDVPMMVASSLLLIVSYLCVGALLQLVTRDLATGLGLAGVIVSPAFGYAGVGFPISGMNAFAQGWSAVLPLRWYMQVLLGQAARGLPLSASALAFATLAALTALYCGLALLRMRGVIRSGWFERERPSEQPDVEAEAPGLGGAFRGEWRRLLGNRSAFTILVLAPLVYGLFYPQPYLNQILRELPIAVVDNDMSDISRQIVETLDASGAVRVVSRPRTLAEAREEIDQGLVFAAVDVPPGTERDLLKGINVHIPAYADATYLFIFRSTASGVAAAISALSSDLTSRGGRTDGSLVKAKLAGASPADILLQPVFNPVGGYASYIVPAAFILILQQTLLVGAAMLACGRREGPGSTLAGVAGRGFAHVTIYLPALAFYLIVLPRVYGFSTLGHIPELFALAALFLLATSFLGQAVGTMLTKTENATLVLLATGLPQFFTTGFAWPREAIPDAALALGHVFPAGFAIDGLVRINQLGASLREVAVDWTGLSALTLVYFGLAAFCMFMARKRLENAQA